ncbi:MAG: hypothetical protein NC409_05525 [Clostridium sp.]|nr:hypothetical protein [Clostridium sp.]
MTALAFLILVLSVVLTSLTSCGNIQSQETSLYQNDMTNFTNTIVAIGENINQIDADSDTAVSELLAYYDEMDEAFLSLTEMDIPSEYADAEILAERASKYMTQAVLYYHTAFEAEVLDEMALETANTYYEKAITYVNYIGEVLLGSHVTFEEG